MKTFCLITLLICLAASARSQKLIPQLGITYSTTNRSITGYPTSSLKEQFIPGLMAGVGVEHTIESNMSLQSGLFYIQKGHSSVLEETYRGYFRTKEKLHIGYLEMPVLLCFSFNSKSNLSYYIRTGPTFGYFLNGKLKQNLYFAPDNGTTPTSRVYEKTVAYDPPHTGYGGDHFYMTRQMDAGLYVGAGVRVNNRVVINVGYTHGLMRNDFYSTKDAGANRVLQLSAGIPIQVADDKSIEPLSGENDEQAKGEETIFYLGFSAGESVTTLTGSEVIFHLDDSTPPKPYLKDNHSVTVALHAKLETYNYFFVKSGLHYIRKGGRVVNDRFTYPLDVRIDYLSIPALIGFQPFNFSNTKIVNVSVEIGISAHVEIGNHKKNLTKGLFPGTPVEMNNFIIAKQVGVNAECKIMDNLIGFINYTSFQDLDPFFKRQFDAEYDISAKGKLFSAGVLMRVNAD